MAPPVLSFAASEIDPATLSRILADYLAYEQARVFRRLLVKRLAIAGLLTLLTAVLVGLLSRPTVWIVLGLLAATGAHAGALELMARARIVRQLAEIPSVPQKT